MGTMDVMFKNSVNSLAFLVACIISNNALSLDVGNARNAVDAGIANLVTLQDTNEGGWGEDSKLNYVYTAAAVEALSAANSQTGAYFSGLAWLENHNADSVDLESRKILALTDRPNVIVINASTSISAANVWNDLANIHAAKQDATQSGWGLSQNYSASPLETAFALKALYAAGDATGQTNAIDFLVASQLDDGGWAFAQTTASQDSNFWITSEVVLALANHQAQTGVASALTQAVQYLGDLVALTATDPDVVSAATLARASLAIYEVNGLVSDVDSLLLVLMGKQNGAGDWGNELTTGNAVTTIATVMGLSVYKDSARVSIEDEQLRIAINRLLGHADYAQLTQADINSLTHLDLTGLGVTNLTGLEYAFNLLELRVDPNTDISAVSALTDINVIDKMTFINALSLITDANFSDCLSSKSEIYAEDITSISCIGRSISSIDGIENFTALRALTLSDNNLTRIDISTNTELSYVNLNGNKITSANLGSNPTLSRLELGNNQLTSLDLSGNSGLTYINLYGNYLNEINLSFNSELDVLNLSENQLTNVDLSNNSKLTFLYLDSNQLSNVDLSNNTKLSYLQLNNNELTNVDLSNNIEIRTLYIHSNQLVNVDLRNINALGTLWLSRNKLSSLDISNNTKLNNLDLEYNQFINVPVGLPNISNITAGLNLLNNPFDRNAVSFLYGLQSTYSNLRFSVNDIDGDGVVDILDDFANDNSASVDADNDGLADAWNSSCDIACQENSSLTLDPSLDDFDNDGFVTANDAFPADNSEWADVNGNGIGDNQDLNITPATNIAYNGWSTMMNTLSGQNTGSSTSPDPQDDPSLYHLVGEMYAANGITDYVSDFEFLPQGSNYIDGAAAVDNINTTSATVAVLSAYGSTSGITMDPATANSANNWIDRMVTAAQAAEAQNIRPIMFQAWGGADAVGSFANAKVNTDALQAKHGMLVIRTAEIVEALGQLNSTYVTNTSSPNGKYAPPVTHLYSGDVTDNFHGSYAMAYVNALATFKALTGISAANNAFVIPSGGASGIQYGMSQTFIDDIIATVDTVQQESLISGLAAGAAPIASNYERDALHNIETSINVSAASTLIDDATIVPSNFVIEFIEAEHFVDYSFTGSVFTFTPSDSYTGSTDVIFKYTDADSQDVYITMTLNISAEIVIDSQEIIIGFGDGNWTSFASSGNLYNHSTTETGEVINGIRTFDSISTQGNLQDSNGLGLGSITTLTSGSLSGPGYTANDNPVVSDYGPYTALYNSLSVAPRGATVSFSINGLDADVNYRVNMAGRYVEEETNIVSVDVNGVLGSYDSDRSPENLTEYDKVVTADGSGKLIITLSSDGTSAADKWGISYVHINKITDGTLADTPVAPNFITQPQSINVTEGANATFTVAATGSYSLQWYRDGQIINGETALSYTLTTAGGDDGAVFTAIATNAGGSTTSSSATLSLLTDMPSITTQPVNALSVMDGNLMSLSVVATGAVTYQWQQDGVDIVGETNRTLSIPVSLSDSASVYTVLINNPFGSVTSEGTTLTVTELLQQYWFSFGRSDGKAANYTDSFTGFIPDVAAEGGNGEDINFIRSFSESPVTRANTFRDTTGLVTDLSLTFTSIGSNTDDINGWGNINSDILLNANTVNILTSNNLYEHTNLYSYYLYMASEQVMQFEFVDGGLVAGEQWKVQILGMHYQDVSRPVDVEINGEGTAGNMQVGDWNNINVFDQVATVDASGKLTIRIATQSNANINAIRLIKTDSVVPSNIAPEASDAHLNIPHNSELTQLDLSSYVNHDGAIDWASLEISQPTNGRAVQNNSTLSIVDFEYMGTEFTGTDNITFSVEDSLGIRSNVATVELVVAAPAITGEITDVNIVSDLQSSQPEGAVVVFSLDAQGGSGNYEYKVIQNDYDEGINNLLQDWSSNNTIEWDTTGHSGSNFIRVYARNTGEEELFYKYISYHVSTSIEGIIVTYDLSKPQTEGAVVTFTFEAQGGSENYEYRFVQIDYDENILNELQDWSESTSVEWDTLGHSGDNYIKVYARNIGDLVYETYSESFYIAPAQVEIVPQEIIIGFGDGNWTSFASSGNLYNHSSTETGEVINGIRTFDSISTQGNLQDSNGLGLGSITTLTSGSLSGPGYTANDNPVVSDYGPYTALYNSLSVAPRGATVSFSVNGLDAGVNYRVNMAGRYVEEETNIVSVDVNGVLGTYDSSRSSDNLTEYDKVVTADGSGKLIITLSSDGTSAADKWGISYVHINKITDGTLADTPVAPNFITQPQSINVTEGANATFTVAATGSYSLQWYRDGQIINGETALSYTLTTAGGDDGAVFTAIATNAGGSTTSSNATLSLLTDMPSITTQPVNALSVMDGNLMSLSVVATGAVTYQWQQDGVDIVGETNRTLSIPVSLSDSASVYTVLINNPFGSVTSEGTTLTVTELLQQYWFSFGRSDGKAANYTDSFTGFIPDVAAEGGNGEDINFIRSFSESPVTRANTFRDTTGLVTDLSLTFTSIGSNTDDINGWGNINSDILLNANTVNILTSNNLYEHTNLYSYYLYMASEQVMQFEFVDGGLVAGEQWKVQILGMHYQDVSRPVDVEINGEGTAGNMQVGDWNNINVFDQVATVDASGKLTIRIATQSNANINAIRLIKI